VAGIDVVNDPLEVERMLAVVPQGSNLELGRKTRNRRYRGRKAPRIALRLRTSIGYDTEPYRILLRSC
jgi:hypothetical protein